MVELAEEHVHLLLGRGVAEVDPHREPVELRLGQRVGAVELDRVLGGDDEERARRADGSCPRSRPGARSWPRAGSDCVRGEARLISSARRTLVKIGPGLKANVPSRGLYTDEPRMSVGRRSGVNWTRLNLGDRRRAPAPWRGGLAHARHVLHEDVSRRRCRAVRRSRITSGLPRMTFPSSASRADRTSRGCGVRAMRRHGGRERKGMLFPPFRAVKPGAPRRP